jgi:ubiquitin-protein ligase
LFLVLVADGSSRGGNRHMITFTCGGCGRSFSVPDGFAGRRATCKACGGPIVVPAPAVTAPTPPAEMTPGKISLRIRRLGSDARQMAEAFSGFPFIQIRKTTGNPADIYEIEYSIRGLQRGPRDEPAPRETHLAEIRLTSDYPRLAPQCKMLTPIFHPNIDTGTICVGDHWTAGERLASLVIRIGEMIAYQAYNIQSPLDAEAAMWADLNRDRLPIDTRNLHPADL